MKRHLISASITFITSFLFMLATVIGALSVEELSNPATYTTSFVFSILLTATRAGIKAVSEKYILK